MSNIGCRRLPRIISRPRANLEDYCRTLVRAGNELYIVCGSYGRGGTGMGYQTTIAEGRTTVLANCWKMVVILPTGSNEPPMATRMTVASESG